MNYYNEWDKATAAWLQELMERGLIPKGHIDTRSIADVQPSDLHGFTQCHFFAGIGGWPLALDLAGWPRDRPVWTGSCPCQDYSAAGKGLGAKGERDLWPAWDALIEHHRPDTVFGEQVEAAIRHGWLDRVRANMERKDYALGAVVLGAHSAGAPHIRQRLYWVADGGHKCRGGWTESNTEKRSEITNNCDMGHPISTGLQGSYNNEKSPTRVQCQLTKSSGISGLPHAGCAGPSEQRGEWNEPEGLAAPGFWSDYDIIPFRDGKARRIGKQIKWMANGISCTMGGLCPGEETQKETVDAKATTTRSDQELQIVRSADDTPEIQRSAGGQGSIQQTGLLQPRVHGARNGGDNQEPNTTKQQTAISEAGQASVREVWQHGDAACPPHRREPTEQCAVQPDDVVRFLSQAMAYGVWEKQIAAAGAMQYLQEALEEIGFLPEALSAVPQVWRSMPHEARQRIGHLLCAREPRWVAISPLEVGEPGRATKLKGYGNAIVPQVAAEFIGAYMEVLA